MTVSLVAVTSVAASCADPKMPDEPMKLRTEETFGLPLARSSTSTTCR